MATLKELWQFLRTHRLKRRVRLALIGVLVIIVGAVIGGVAVSAHNKRVAIQQAARLKPAGPTKAELAQKRTALQKALQQYFDQQAASGKVQLSLYSLAPQPGSKAAKKPDGIRDGRGKIVAAAQADKQVLSASTYKLYIAAYVFHRLQAGTIDWTLTDKANFDAMIVNSENGYAQTILTRYGNDKVDAYLDRLGLGKPFSGDAAETTANRLVKVLQLLDAGKGPFADKKLRTRLLKDMGKQVFRNGMPAGVASIDKKATVQDKVGFLTDTNNDAGIVTTADGHRYILVIMTTGHAQLDFSQIKTIAAETQRLYDSVD